MKGFEITINNDKKTLAVNKGVVIVALSYEFGISFSGMDDEEGIRLKWNNCTIETGDKITIIPTDTDFTDSPKSKILIKKKKLLESYLNLKEVLAKKGKL